MRAHTIDRAKILTAAEWSGKISPALAAAPPRDRILVWTLALTGARRSEAAAMRVEDLHLESSPPWIRMRRAKRGVHPDLPISRELSGMLRAFVGLRREGPLWISRKHGAPLTADAVNRIVMRVGEAAGVPWLHAHSLRHLYATQLYRLTGGDIRHVQVRLGHVSITSTQSYVDVMLDDDGKYQDGLSAALGLGLTAPAVKSQSEG